MGTYKKKIEFSLDMTTPEILINDSNRPWTNLAKKRRLSVSIDNLGKPRLASALKKTHSSSDIVQKKPLQGAIKTSSLNTTTDTNNNNEKMIIKKDLSKFLGEGAVEKLKADEKKEREN